MEDISGFILAGGKSSRMGTEKAFLKIHSSKTFLEHAVDRLKHFCHRVFVVLNDDREKVVLSSLEVEQVFDIFKESGALGGIHASLKNCQSTFAFILAVDLPLVRDETIASLIETIRKDREADAVVPVELVQGNFCQSGITEFKGLKSREIEGKGVEIFRIQPLCAVYRAEKCASVVEKILVKKESASVCEFLDRVSTKLVGFTGEEFLNVNTPEEYKRALQLWQRR